MPIIGTFEDDFDTDGFASDDVIQFELRRRLFTCRRLTSEDRDKLFASAQSNATEESFFRAVLIPDDVDPFFAMANDPVNPVKKKTIEDLAGQVGTAVLGIEADPKPKGSSPTSKPKGRKRTGG